MRLIVFALLVVVAVVACLSVGVRAQDEMGAPADWLDFNDQENHFGKDPLMLTADDVEVDAEQEEEVPADGDDDIVDQAAKDLDTLSEKAGDISFLEIAPALEANTVTPEPLKGNIIIPQYDATPVIVGEESSSEGSESQEEKNGDEVTAEAVGESSESTESTESTESQEEQKEQAGDNEETVHEKLNEVNEKLAEAKEEEEEESSEEQEKEAHENKEELTEELAKAAEEKAADDSVEEVKEHAKEVEEKADQANAKLASEEEAREEKEAKVEEVEASAEAKREELAEAVQETNVKNKVVGIKQKTNEERKEILHKRLDQIEKVLNSENVKDAEADAEAEEQEESNPVDELEKRVAALEKHVLEVHHAQETEQEVEQDEEAKGEDKKESSETIEAVELGEKVVTPGFWQAHLARVEKKLHANRLEPPLAAQIAFDNKPSESLMKN